MPKMGPKIQTVERLFERQLELRRLQIQLSDATLVAHEQNALVVSLAAKTLHETISICAAIKERQRYSDECKDRFKRRRLQREQEANNDPPEVLQEEMLAIEDDPLQLLAMKDGQLQSESHESDHGNDQTKGSPSSSSQRS